jgi:hypothetical protein
MSNPTKIVRDDAYEDMASAYQCLLIATLDQTLRENGIADTSLRQKVCGDYFFAVGNLHDQGWFKPSKDLVYPILCFSKTFLNIDTNVEELGTLYACSKYFSYHEYAFGNVDAVFEGEPAAQIEAGCVGDLKDS